MRDEIVRPREIEGAAIGLGQSGAETVDNDHLAHKESLAVMEKVRVLDILPRPDRGDLPRLRSAAQARRSCV